MLLRTSFVGDRYVWTAEVSRTAAEILGAQEPAIQAALLRDIAGNPFHRPAVDESWRRRNDGCAAKIARTIYEWGRFADLPILGDALEDAGCPDETILTHCRSGKEHVRGCWVVDAVLGKR
jgi:hypothetical protein